MEESKTILITGAGSGIGKDASIALSKRGHKVIATTETKDQADKLLEEFSSLGLIMEVEKLDVTYTEDRQFIRHRELDVLINNAGIGESGPLSEIDFDRVRNNFEINVFGAFELSQLALKNMMKNNRGIVLFISSLFGRVTSPFLGPYCMTKFALAGGVEAMRAEIHRVRKNVHVSLIEPGGYHTGFNQKNVARKYEWLNEDSEYFNIIQNLKKEEERQFNFVELKSTKSIVNQIVKAAEAKKPRLRYTSPKWQSIGIQFMRAFGK